MPQPNRPSAETAAKAAPSEPEEEEVQAEPEEERASDSEMESDSESNAESDAEPEQNGADIDTVAEELEPEAQLAHEPSSEVVSEPQPAPELQTAQPPEPEPQSSSGAEGPDAPVDAEAAPEPKPVPEPEEAPGPEATPEPESPETEHAPAPEHGPTAEPAQTPEREPASSTSEPVQTPETESDEALDPEVDTQAVPRPTTPPSILDDAPPEDRETPRDPIHRPLPPPPPALFDETADTSNDEVIPKHDSALFLRQNGQIYMVGDWATLERWVAERRVDRTDEVSAGGVQWEPVGDLDRLNDAFHEAEQDESPYASQPPEGPEDVDAAGDDTSLPGEPAPEPSPRPRSSGPRSSARSADSTENHRSGVLQRTN